MKADTARWLHRWANERVDDAETYPVLYGWLCAVGGKETAHSFLLWILERQFPASWCGLPLSELTKLCSATYRARCKPRTQLLCYEAMVPEGTTLAALAATEAPVFTEPADMVIARLEKALDEFPIAEFSACGGRAASAAVLFALSKTLPSLLGITDSVANNLRHRAKKVRRPGARWPAATEQKRRAIFLADVEKRIKAKKIIQNIFIA